MRHTGRLRRLDANLESMRNRAACPPILLQQADGTLAAHNGQTYADRAAAASAWPERPGVPALTIVRLVTPADLSALNHTHQESHHGQRPQV